MTNEVGRATLPLSVLTNVASWAPTMRDNPWTSVEHWYVDGSNVSGLASDDNRGTTDTAPLLTFAQLSKRLALRPQEVDAVVHVMSSRAAGDNLDLFVPLDRYRLSFVGDMTEVATGTFSTVDDLDQAGGTLTRIVDASKPDDFFADYATAAYILEDVTSGAFVHVFESGGAKDATVSPPINAITPPAGLGNAAFPTAGTLAPGDTYKIWRMPLVDFSRAATGLNPNLSFQHVQLRQNPTFGDTPYLQAVFDGLVIAEASLSGDFGFFASTALATQALSNVRVACPLATGIGQIFGGILSGQLFGIGPGVVVDLNAILATSVAMPWAGTLQLGEVYVAGNVDSYAWPGGPINGYGGIAGICIGTLVGAGTGCVYGPGKLRIHAGSTLAYQGDAVDAFKNAGGIEVDGGVQAQTSDTDGSPTTFRNVTPANLDAAIGSGGFNGACVTRKGTRVFRSA